MSNNYNKAYTEVLETLSHLPNDEYSKIPTEKIKFYKENISEYTTEANNNQQLVEYKESFFIKFINFIKRILNIK